MQRARLPRSWRPCRGRRASWALRVPAAGLSSFTVQTSKLWTRDLVQLTPGVKVRQEATDWEKALPFGLGAVVWDSAAAFCKLVEALEQERLAEAADTGSFWKGRAVLELGAGCGAAGLALAAKGAAVTLSDRTELLPLMERNVALNPQLQVQVRSLRWEEISVEDFRHSAAGAEPRPLDVVLATDVVGLDPDRPRGEPPFDALRHALSTLLEGAPECLCIFIFEERGLLTLPALGELFGPLARDGELWEFVPPPRLNLRPRQGNPLRYLCLHGADGAQRAGGAVAEWRRLLGEDAFVRRWAESDFDTE